MARASTHSASWSGGSGAQPPASRRRALAEWAFRAWPRSFARQALLSGSDALARGTMRLEQGQRMLLETENMGNDVLVSLQRQRQQIKSAQCVRNALA
jgi:hypothetical protein